jgi:hypothetical protein
LTLIFQEFGLRDTFLIIMIFNIFSKNYVKDSLKFYYFENFHKNIFKNVFTALQDGPYRIVRLLIGTAACLVLAD